MDAKTTAVKGFFHLVGKIWDFAKKREIKALAALDVMFKSQ